MDRIDVRPSARVALAGLAFLAMAVCAWGQPQRDGASPQTSAPTPRTPDGKPDLSGYWTLTQGAPGINRGQNTPDDLVSVTRVRNGDLSNLTNDNVIARRSGDNLPVYKPEYWDKVLDLDLNGNLQDTFTSCMPMGIPRMGPPTRIAQTATDVFMFYTVQFERNEFRAVPIGPRTHPIDRDGTWLGDPVASWDGDTLVIVTEGFNDQTWIGAEGYLHSYDLKVTEKFNRQGDAMTYDVTIEDPEVLQKPWVLQTRRLRRITDPNYRMEEAPPCSDHDNAHLQDKNREL